MPTSETCTHLVEEERDDGRLTVTTVVVGGKGEEPLGGKGGGDSFFVFFRNLLGFLFGWSTVLLVRPASNAVQFLTFGEYFSQALLIVSGAGGRASPGLVTVLALTSGSKCVRVI